jgi:hypothetical protein
MRSYRSVSSVGPISGGSRQGRACHPFRDGWSVKHVRQTLTDAGACIGDVEWGFPDGNALHVRLFHHDLLQEGQGRLEPVSPAVGA